MNNKMELSLLDRRLIAKLTINNKADWINIIKMGHTIETYNSFNIPKFENDVENYFQNNKPNINLLEINEIIILYRIIKFEIYSDGGTIEFVTNIGVHN